MCCYCVIFQLGKSRTGRQNVLSTDDGMQPVEKRKENKHQILNDKGNSQYLQRAHSSTYNFELQNIRTGKKTISPRKHDGTDQPNTDVTEKESKQKRMKSQSYAREGKLTPENPYYPLYNRRGKVVNNERDREIESRSKSRTGRQNVLSTDDGMQPVEKRKENKHQILNDKGNSQYLQRAHSSTYNFELQNIRTGKKTISPRKHDGTDQPNTDVTEKESKQKPSDKKHQASKNQNQKSIEESETTKLVQERTKRKNKYKSRCDKNRSN
uniref:uncharacterized protein LOC120343029 n=1 Tax=Styela clava TaxID=7725 RepID=UPI0019395C45|nr:uncharacterized protein LOC120343029 [Styela clava]